MLKHSVPAAVCGDGGIDHHLADFGLVGVVRGPDVEDGSDIFKERGTVCRRVEICLQDLGLWVLLLEFGLRGRRVDGEAEVSPVGEEREE